MIWRLPLLLIVLAVAAAAQRDLTALLDPRADDWRAEALATTAGDQLSAVLSALLGGRELDAELLAPAARSAQLAPPVVGAADRDAAEALSQWRAAFIGTGSRAKVKLLSAELQDDGFVALARIEALGDLPAQQVQQIAHWRVRWVVGAEDRLRLQEIGVVDGEQATSPALWFHDVTAAVLPRALRERPDLRRGGDEWPRYLDRVGESTRMGHQGLALGDVDGDGREDLYVAMCGGLPNLLLRQQADGSFVDVAAAAGVAFLDDTKGVLLVDIDGDGDDDLLAAIGPFVLLMHNDGSGKFARPVQLRAPTDGAFYHLTVADYDRDGDLDIYGCRYVEEAWATSVPMPYHDADNGPGNVLFRNDGDSTFVDATADVGLDQNNRRFSTAAAWADVDSDGDLDLYVSNDFGRNNLYRNDDGVFTDVAAAAGVEDQAAGMGVAFADVDGDGDLDLYVTNMFSSAGHRIGMQPRFQDQLPAAERRAIQQLAYGNSLYLNRGDGTFGRSTDAAVRMGRWGWGARFCDLDDDGREDIVAPNGFLTGHAPADC